MPTNFQPKHLRPSLTGDTAAATLELSYLWDVLGRLPQEWRTAVDIGAHKGDVTAALVDLGYRVLAVEPQPRMADRLEDRLRNAITAGYVRVARCAASDTTGDAQFFVGSASTVCSLEESWTTDVFPEYFNEKRTIEVPVRRAADLLRQRRWARAGFAKIDVEGHELPAIRGLIDEMSFEELPRVVMFEASETFPEKAEDCLTLLWDKGYRLFDGFFRHGIQPTAVERTDSAQLPGAWHGFGGRPFFANFLAYHPSLDPAKLPDPSEFMSEYYVEAARAWLAKAPPPCDCAMGRLRNFLLLEDWRGVKSHPLLREIDAPARDAALDERALKSANTILVESHPGARTLAETLHSIAPRAAHVLVDTPERLALHYYFLSLSMPQRTIAFLAPGEAPAAGQTSLATELPEGFTPDVTIGGGGGGR